MKTRDFLIFLFISVLSIHPARGEYDYTMLSRMKNIDVLIKDFYALRSDALAVPQEEKRPDLYLKTQYWTSRNPALRSYCEEFLRNTPHTVQTVGSRITTIEIMGCLTAEWSVRLLFEEIMIDREGQEMNGYEGPQTEEALINMAMNGEFRDFKRNDHMAAQKIFSMKLVGAPETVSLGFSPAQFKELQEWYQQNKHRLDEVVHETWGEYAVLDEDFPPEVGSSGKPVPNDIREEKLQHPAPAKHPATDTAHPAVDNPDHRLLVFIIAGLAVVGIYFFLRPKGSR